MKRVGELIVVEMARVIVAGSDESVNAAVPA